MINELFSIGFDKVKAKVRETDLVNSLSFLIVVVLK